MAQVNNMVKKAAVVAVIALSALATVSAQAMAPAPAPSTGTGLSLSASVKWIEMQCGNTCGDLIMMLLVVRAVAVVGAPFASPGIFRILMELESDSNSITSCVDIVWKLLVHQEVTLRVSMACIVGIGLYPSSCMKVISGYSSWPGLMGVKHRDFSRYGDVLWSFAGTIQAELCHRKQYTSFYKAFQLKLLLLFSSTSCSQDIWRNQIALARNVVHKARKRVCKAYDEFDSLYKEMRSRYTVFKLVKDLHTTNVDQIHAYLEQHERHVNEILLMHEVLLMYERSSDPLALVASHQMTKYPYQSLQILPGISTFHNLSQSSIFIGDTFLSYAVATRTLLRKQVGSTRGNRGLYVLHCHKGEGTCPKQCTNKEGKRDDYSLKEKVVVGSSSRSSQILHEEELAFLEDQEFQKLMQHSTFHYLQRCLSSDDLDALEL
ncbi:hypothetical protein Tco_0704477 [Tanacetum coccineum]|uniref:Uncharacterized protein n=1 Tax=Tanacetum coccineum TaxID=301880 RepID=A0ABQ4Y253_9ASTR